MLLAIRGVDLLISFGSPMPRELARRFGRPENRQARQHGAQVVADGDFKASAGFDYRDDRRHARSSLLDCSYLSMDATARPPGVIAWIKRMKKRFSNFHMRRSVIVSELLRDLLQAELGRYGSMISCGLRPDRFSELIVHLCMYQPEVRDRYPNPDEAYLAVDVFDHHSPELRQARMRKLLSAGLAEYWALDIVKRTPSGRQSSSKIA